MAKKKEDEVGLVVFRSVKKVKDLETSEVSLEDIDQEDKIKIMYELVPHANSWRYSILLLNQSLAPISEIKIRVKYPSFLSLKRFSPPSIHLESSGFDSDTDQLNFEFDELAESSKKQINFYFSLNRLNEKGKIATSVTYVNNKDYVRAINSKPVKININEVKITPKIISSSEIQAFLKKDNIKRAIKSIGLGIEEMEFDFFFNSIEQILKLHSFQLITKDEVDQRLWFFGSEVGSNEDVLLIGQIEENKIEFLAASENHPILISLLTNLTMDFVKRISITGTIKSSEDLYDLECKNCGAILSYFPYKNESIVCKNCGTAQILW